MLRRTSMRRSRLRPVFRRKAKHTTQSPSGQILPDCSCVASLGTLVAPALGARTHVSRFSRTRSHRVWRTSAICMISVRMPPRNWQHGAQRGTSSHRGALFPVSMCVPLSPSVSTVRRLHTLCLLDAISQIIYVEWNAFMSGMQCIQSQMCSVWWVRLAAKGPREQRLIYLPTREYLTWTIKTVFLAS